MLPFFLIIFLSILRVKNSGRGFGAVQASYGVIHVAVIRWWLELLSSVDLAWYDVQGSLLSPLVFAISDADWSAKVELFHMVVRVVCTSFVMVGFLFIENSKNSKNCARFSDLDSRIT